MNFIKSKVSNSNSQTGIDNTVNLCAKMWEILEGESRGGIIPKNLEVFAGAILKISIHSKPITTNAHYGTFNSNGEFEVTQKQIMVINKEFNCFYMNKTTNATNEAKTQKKDEYTFKPSVCGKSSSIVKHKPNSLTKESHVEKMMKLKKLQEE